MIKMYVWSGFLLLSVIYAANSAIQSEEELAKAINQVFNIETEECECLPYYQCFKNNTIKLHGEGLLDTRFRTDEDCESKDGQIMVCCYLPENPTPMITKVTTPISIVTPTEIVTPTKTITSTEIVTPKVYTDIECGISNSGNGIAAVDPSSITQVRFGQFPWMVELLKMDYFFNYGLSCGGSLIHPQVVMTAAHCISNKNPTNYRIRAGSINRNIHNKVLEQEADVATIIVHPGYYSGSLYNDIALLILENPFKITNVVSTICLPSKNNDVFNGLNCALTGWGTSNSDSSTIQKDLRAVQYSIVEKNECLETLQAAKINRIFHIHRNTMCARGTAKQNECVEDNGGPLVCLKEKIHVQAGIVSWGVGCSSSQSATPGLFTNVAHFSSWISEQIRVNGL